VLLQIAAESRNRFSYLGGSVIQTLQPTVTSDGPLGCWGREGRLSRKGRDTSQVRFPEFRLHIEADDFGPRLSPLAVLPVGLFDCVL